MCFIYRYSNVANIFPVLSLCYYRCYNKLYKTGMYKGQGHCILYEEAMRQCLRKKGLYPA